MPVANGDNAGAVKSSLSGAMDGETVDGEALKVQSVQIH
jgi:hypothetical protein